jgi:hypothetical protein
MIPLEQCRNIPKGCPTLDKVESSANKKLLKYEGLWFYITENQTEYCCIYSVELGKQIIWADTKNKALTLLNKHIKILKEVINDNNI